MIINKSDKNALLNDFELDLELDLIIIIISPDNNISLDYQCLRRFKVVILCSINALMRFCFSSLLCLQLFFFI
jgi:predicted ABC-type ATPase